MTITSTRNAGIAAAGLTLAALLLTNLVNNDAGESGGPTEFLVLLAICAGVGAWLFSRTIPRALERGPQRAATVALVLAVAALIAWGLFWSGLPFLLAPAAIALGELSRSRGAGTRAALATGLGALALLASIALLVADELDLA